MSYYCYIIAFIENYIIKRTYIGITNNLKRRIKQHNGEVKGGAKSTRCSNEWFYYMIVNDFKNKEEALSFEWYWKKYSKSGIDNRIKQLYKLLQESKWSHLKIRTHEEMFCLPQVDY